jgi:hypothetical protein
MARASWAIGCDTNLLTNQELEVPETQPDHATAAEENTKTRLATTVQIKLLVEPDRAVSTDPLGEYLGLDQGIVNQGERENHKRLAGASHLQDHNELRSLARQMEHFSIMQAQLRILKLPDRLG